MAESSSNASTFTDATLGNLINDLVSPDPSIRDERGFGGLADALQGEVSDADRVELGRAMLERLGHARVEARTFAPLVLAVLTETGTFDPTWVDAMSDWYLGERDLRGHDPEVGWIHAVAHGSDFFGTVGVKGLADPARLLETLIDRVVAPTDFVWRDQEDDRVAYAMALVMTQPSATFESRTGWLGRVDELLAAGEPGPVPAQATNTMHTLRSLYVALSEQLLHDGEPIEVPDAADVRAQIAARLAQFTPWVWRAHS